MAKNRLFNSLSLSLGLRVMARGSEGGSWEAYSTGLYKDPQIVRDFSRLSDKPGITIFVRRARTSILLTPSLLLT